MRDNLVPIKIEVDPLLGRASFVAAHDSAVEPPRFGKIMHREGEVEGA
jgi:hypothetical protein